MAYQGLRRAVLNFDYLHTNSTTHEFLFGALAELLDNSRDAQATKIDVFTVDEDELRGGFLLCFLDDGHGMDMNESTNVFQFGKSYKRAEDSNLIGQYGNGLKSGSMRIGNDFIMFTKRNGEMTCLFLSRTFHAEEKIEEVIVPMPSFNAHTCEPLTRTAAERNKHRIEMELILKYSPFKTEEDFFEQFNKIVDHGTLVIVYNMKLMDNGLPELDIRTDTSDILLAGTMTIPGENDDSFVPERKSFREYTSILYANPKMKVYIQGNKVRTKKLGALLYKPKVYKYSSNKFKARSEADAKKATEEAKSADAKAREAESKARDLENKYGQGGSKDQRSSLRKTQADAIEMRNEAKVLSAIADHKDRACKEPKTLNFVFGINIGNRKMDGCFMYNCGRLIKMYEKVGPQLEGGVQCSGVIGYVDIPYMVLEPTHNKQDFADNREYTILKKALGEYMLDYWKNCSGVPSQGVLKFWETFGYISNNWKDAASDEPKFLRKRLMNLPTMIQCDLCLKWRKLPFSSSNLTQDFPEHWDCEMNPDTSHNRCSQVEEKLNIAVAQYKKEIKSAEEKLEMQQEKARKEFEKLQAMKKNSEPIRKDPPMAALGRRSAPERTSSRPNSYSDRAASSRSTAMDRRREQRKPSPPPPPKPTRPVGKAKPVLSTREKTPAKPIGKASPVVQTKSNSNSRTAFISRSSSRASSRTPAPTIKANNKKSNSTPSRSSRTATKRKIESSSEEEDDSSSEEEENDSDEEEEESEEEEKVEVKKRKTTTNSKQNASKKAEKKEILSSPATSEIDTDSEALGQKVEAKITGLWHVGKVYKVQRKGQSERWRIKFDKNPKDKFDKWFESDSKDIRVATSEAEESDASVTDKKRTSKTNNETVAKSKQSQAATTKEPVVKERTSSRTKQLEKKKEEEEEEEEEDENMDTTPPAETKKGKAVAKETPDVKEKEKTVAKGNEKEADTEEAASDASSAAVPAEASEHKMKGKKMVRTHQDHPDGFRRPWQPWEPEASKEVFEKLGNGYRKCLRYFLPPSWSMNKDQINGLTLNELSDFSLESFFDHYEKGLRELVGGFQIQAQEKEAEANDSKQKLGRLRKMIAQLLKSINDDINISENCEGEEIDDLLAECVRQAQQEDT